MATHDYVIDNATGAAVRADINNVLQAIATNNSGSSEPSTKYASQFFADTSEGIMKLRNTTNNGYVNLFTLAGGIDVDAASNFNQDVTFTGSSANILFDQSSNSLEFADNAKATFGTSADLEIFHNGTNSIIDNNTGNLEITCGSFFVNNAANNEVQIKAVQNGQVELYHNNTKRFETTASGCEISGFLDIVLGTTGTIAEFKGADTDLLNIDGDSDKMVLDARNVSALAFEMQGTEAMRIDNSERVAIGTTTASVNLHVKSNSGTGEILRVESSGSASNQVFIGFRRQGDSDTGGIRRDSSTSGPEFFAASDRRIKTNIVDMDNVLDKIKQLSLKKFDYKDGSGSGIGLIAQDLINIFPNKVSKDDSDDGSGDTVPDDIEPWTVGHNFTFELLKAVQELIAKVEALESA
tara:strand:- start:778 stop:2007 length:1230 start_codon:yes stop_codon:yes gene_type:complete